MKDHYPKFKAAAVQSAPVYLNREASIDKACSLIDEAGQNGAKLIAFPEAYIPGYPWWIWFGSPDYGMKYFVEFYKNAVTIPSKEVHMLGQAAKRNGIYVCISVTEKDGGSLYLTQLWFNPRGDLIGKHRKCKPSGAERTIWGEGDGSTMPVFDTEIGRLGGLECWEHLIPANIMAMNAQNEQVHVSSWPSFFPVEGHLFSTYPCETGAKTYSIINQVYSLVSSQIYTEEMRDMICETEEQKNIMQVGHGCTKIIDPNGLVISEVPPHEEGICYADLDLETLILGKYLTDPAGHYSTTGHLRMIFDQSEHKPVKIIGIPVDNCISFEELQISE